MATTAVKRIRAPKRIAKIVASASSYIDPLNCDSTISYKIVDAPKRVWGSVQLADCNRKIEWYFGQDDAVDKVEKAIAVLMNFRDELNQAKAERRKRPRLAAKK